MSVAQRMMPIQKQLVQVAAAAQPCTFASVSVCQIGSSDLQCTWVLVVEQ